MSGIRFFSTGGSLMNLTSPDWPGTAIATLHPFSSLRSVNVASASRTSSSGIGVGLAQDLGILDEVERLGHDLVGRLARDELDRLECGLADVDRPDGLNLSHAVELLRGVRVGNSCKGPVELREVRSCG